MTPVRANRFAVLSALGVVFGDIGTSPLYALKECFLGSHAVPLTNANILGVLSLILWSLLLVVTFKYLFFVIRADNKGEGGILALMALAAGREKNHGKRTISMVIVAGLFGSALLYGDGVITPAISVLSAVEGLTLVTSLFDPYVQLITIFILATLFYAQSVGTQKIGSAFGPIILVWFITMAILGLSGIIRNPIVLTAINPVVGFEFLMANSLKGFLVLGSVFLVVTGAEALYADLGHFGIKPIKRGWMLIVLPSLVMQYLGQGALLMSDPTAIKNPFFLLAPAWALVPLVCLATIATIIASQALITGAFSLSQQAVQLGFLPRLRITHTSKNEKGQIYVPAINWALMVGTIYLVLEFKTAGNLAAAYGIAVTATMLITTILLFMVMRRRWRIKKWKVYSLIAIFLIVDIGFFGANAAKIKDGGWFPLLLAAVIFLLMSTWKKGRGILASRLLEASYPLDDFLKKILPTTKNRASGVAVFLSATPSGIPPALLKNTLHNQVVHETVLLLTILTQDVPHVLSADRVQIEGLGMGFYRVIVNYGFMESPDIPNVIDICSHQGLAIDTTKLTYFLGRETIIASKRHGMAIWRERLFAVMSQNAQRATDFFKIPSDKAIEIGSVIDM